MNNPFLREELRVIGFHPLISYGDGSYEPWPDEPPKEKTEAIRAAHGKPYLSDEVQALSGILSPEEWTAYRALLVARIRVDRAALYADRIDHYLWDFLDAETPEEQEAIRAARLAEKREIQAQLPYPE